MKITWLLITIVFISIQASSQPYIKRENLFDSDWRFHRGGAQGAENPEFDDSGWIITNLPHDWSIEDLPDSESPFSINAITQVSGGFTTGGTGWYRKTFTVDDKYRDKRFIILFEGIYMNSEIWLNGRYLGGHPYGYSSFWLNLTDMMKFGAENVLCIKVKNEGENSRWYSGSGIYRHVWLYVVSPVHTEVWGTDITTPKVSDSEAIVNIKTTIVNDGNEKSTIRLVTRIFDKNNKEVAEKEISATIDSGDKSHVEMNISLSDPFLWSPDSPQLYKAVSEIYDNENIKDQTVTMFGIRSLEFNTAEGFKLNGKTMKLKGGCIHHDNGPLGSRAYDRAEERRAELLKSNGFNSVRCSHNPPSPAFLEACDRIGIMVIDETFDMWNDPKNPYDYHLYFDEWWKKDIDNMVLRDRNHPSVIMWSIGNEIPGRHKPEVVATAKMLGDYIRDLDNSRPVTSAVNDLKPDKDAYFATLDIAGYNYATGGDHNQQSLYLKDHIRIPQRIMYGSESYPLEAFGAWMNVSDNTFVIGDFVWTAFDYIGEASIGWRGYWQKQDFFPWNLAYCGDLDICGWKRPQSFYRDALWKDNQLSIWITPPSPSFELNPERQPWSKWHWADVVDDWTWPGYEENPLEISVYSSCEEVDLLLNGISLGRKPTNRSTEFTAKWKIPYQSGILRAVGYSGRKKVNTVELRSAEKAAVLRLTADRTNITADGQDLSYITVELVDTNGIRNPKAENLISFEIEGPGSIIGVGNANPVSLESYQLLHRKAWHGRCMVIIKSEKNPGKITLKANSPGFEMASIELFSD